MRFHPSFVISLVFGTVLQWHQAGLCFCTIWKEGGLVVLPRRNLGRICAKLWYSGPTWTKNSAYRTVPFLDFWVLGWYWNYYQLFWKFMKGIGCWRVGCIGGSWNLWKGGGVAAAHDYFCPLFGPERGGWSPKNGQNWPFFDKIFRPKGGGGATPATLPLDPPIGCIPSECFESTHKLAF